VNWKLVIAVIAHEFKFSPNDIMDFDLDDLDFWLDRYTELQEWKEKSHG
jgi:hypothetical protein